MQALTFVFAFVAVLALIGVAAWLVRRFAGNRRGANTNRGRMPRLAVIDAAAGDGRRRPVLGGADKTEPPLMAGGQHQSRADAAARRDRRRRGGRPPAAGAGATRQHRASPDDRRSDRYRRGTQYRACDAGAGSGSATAWCRGTRA